MKRITAIILPLMLLAIIQNGFGQEVVHFRVNFGAGMSSLPNSAPGLALYIEPSWKTANFAFGLKGQITVLNNSQESNYLVNGISAWSFNGQYYFTKGPQRLFAGVGVGFYSATRMGGYLCDCEEKPQSNVIGFSPRVGIAYKHLILLAEYNLIHRVKLESASDIPAPGPRPSSISYFNPSYFTFTVGVIIGSSAK